MATKFFSEGDKVCAADLNAIADMLARVDAGTQSGHTFVIGATFAFGTGWHHTHIRQKRFLTILSSGSIVDPSGNHPNKNIGQDGISSVDLDSLGWLRVGMLYYVEGCTYAMEEDF